MSAWETAGAAFLAFTIAVLLLPAGWAIAKASLQAWENMLRDMRNEFTRRRGG